MCHKRKAQIEKAVRNDPKIARLLKNKTIVRVIVVPDKIINFITKEKT